MRRLSILAASFLIGLAAGCSHTNGCGNGCENGSGNGCENGSANGHGGGWRFMTGICDCFDDCGCAGPVRPRVALGPPPGPLVPPPVPGHVKSTADTGLITPAAASNSAPAEAPPAETPPAAPAGEKDAAAAEPATIPPAVPADLPPLPPSEPK